MKEQLLNLKDKVYFLVRAIEKSKRNFNRICCGFFLIIIGFILCDLEDKFVPLYNNLSVKKLGKLKGN